MTTLEGVLIAFLALFAPDRDGAMSAMPAVAAEAACQPYRTEAARRNCIARLDRRVQIAAAGEPFPAEVTWIAPGDPGMPGRYHTLRATR